MRVNRDEIDYKEFLLQVGNGSLPTFDRYGETIRLPDRCCLNERASIVSHTFGQVIDPNDASMYRRVILTPKNDAQ
jgi:hypothetical protein